MEVFFILWLICYLITFIIICCFDHRYWNWGVYSILCVFFWPLIWLYLFWPSENKKTQGKKH